MPAFPAHRHFFCALSLKSTSSLPFPVEKNSAALCLHKLNTRCRTALHFLSLLRRWRDDEEQQPQFIDITVHVVVSIEAKLSSGTSRSGVICLEKRVGLSPNFCFIPHRCKAASAEKFHVSFHRELMRKIPSSPGGSTAKWSSSAIMLILPRLSRTLCCLHSLRPFFRALLHVMSFGSASCRFHQEKQFRCDRPRWIYRSEKLI